MNDALTRGPSPAKHPPRWSVRNWPVRWKALAIGVVPLVLVMVFGGLRIHGALTDAAGLRLAADRAAMVPALTNYISALDNAMIVGSADGDIRGAEKNYESRKYELQVRLSGIDLTADVRSGVTTLLNAGQGLLDQISSNSIGLRDRVTSYAPILLTAEDAITGSVRVDSEQILAKTQGLSRAVGLRGQMAMQNLLVTRGGELPEPELRTLMTTLAGAEPSALSGMSGILVVSSPDAGKLREQMVTRMAMLSDPASGLVNNPGLLASIEASDAIARRVIDDTTASMITSLGDQAADRRNAAIGDAVLVLATIAIALMVVLLAARSLVRPLRVLRDGALKIAHEDLEHEIAEARAGDTREPAPLPVYTTEEVGQVAHAIDELHARALLLAGDEARLRLLVNDMFETMSRRNRSLVDQQLSLIDRLERNEEDPDRLDSLFRLDHLAARMRRNGANLLVLAGAQTSQGRREPVPLSTVVDAAASEVEDYQRVDTAMLPGCTLTGAAATDVVHLLAELIDNALRYSPPTSPVRICAEHTDDAGVLVEVTDTGLGMTDADLRMANMRLSAGGEVTPDSARHMGLFVIGRLAHRHGIQVRLRSSGGADSGIAAEVRLPPQLLVGATPAVADTAVRNGSYPAEPAVSPLPRREPSAQSAAPPTGVPTQDLIYQGMLSEWLVDPYELGRSRDLDWQSVWDHGWSVAADVDNVPVTAHTDHGLPVREPGARLVPGAASRHGADGANREHRVASSGGSFGTTSRPQAPERDPDAVRASISSHFGGVRAGRSHARKTPQEPDHG